MSSSDPNSHSDPITINPPSHRARSHSVSEGSDSDSVPPLSPSQSPASAASVNIQTPFSSSSRIPLSPISPSSPILSYFYGPANKTPFNRGNPAFEDDEPQEPPPTPASPHSVHHPRRMSTSWIPVRFSPQQQQQNPPSTESQQDRGAGVLRRLSMSGSLASKPQLSTQARSTSPPKQSGGTRPTFAPSPRSARKAATLSAATVNANSKPRAPSPMGERILKGHYDGF